MARRFFDTHAHIGLIDSDPVEKIIITREAAQAGVSHIINVSNNIADFDVCYDELRGEPNVLFGVGISPSEVEYVKSGWEDAVIERGHRDKVVGYGEIGLDYYKKFGSRKDQIELFIRQLDLANQLNLPVMVHNREAGSDVLEILRDRTPSKSVIMHCFSENLELASQYLEVSDRLYISFAGNVTYKSALFLQKVAAEIPLERILVESEAPFMVPFQYRGERNRVSYLPYTADFVAALRPEDDEEVYSALYDNACRAFELGSNDGSDL